MPPKSNEIHLFIETPGGDRFECDVSEDTELSTLAADFFEDREDWSTTDRAVVELVDPENPGRTKRLRAEQTLDYAGVYDGAILRIFPEAISGRVDERERVSALVADHQDMINLVEWNSHIEFKPNTNHAPTRYEITFDYRSFRELSADGHTPIFSTEHRIEIVLGADYPRRAPMVRWLTPIFHPNIRRDGAVCLGVLMERYRPGMGLARLVTMLAEMAQWRNFDMTNSLNETAAEWAANPDHWDHIYAIGGSPFQGPVNELFQKLEDLWGGKEERPRVKFGRVTGERNK